MVNFWKGAIYAIKTAVGVSKQKHSHSEESAVFGTRQVSVQSMYAWGMIVSRLVDLHNKYGQGAQYSDPIDKLQQVIVGILSFVDDCNLSNTGEKHDTVKDVLQRTQHDAQLWNDFIQASGARIELSKCFTQIIDFKFSLCGVSAVGRLQKNLHLELINCTTSQKVQINPISSCSTY